MSAKAALEEHVQLHPRGNEKKIYSSELFYPESMQVEIDFLRSQLEGNLDCLDTKVDTKIEENQISQQTSFLETLLQDFTDFMVEVEPFLKIDIFRTAVWDLQSRVAQAKEILEHTVLVNSETWQLKQTKFDEDPRIQEIIHRATAALNKLDSRASRALRGTFASTELDKVLDVLIKTAVTQKDEATKFKESSEKWISQLSDATVK